MSHKTAVEQGNSHVLMCCVSVRVIIQNKLQQCNSFRPSQAKLKWPLTKLISHNIATLPQQNGPRQVEVDHYTQGKTTFLGEKQRKEIRCVLFLVPETV